jgi:hypothetical protein
MWELLCERASSQFRGQRLLSEKRACRRGADPQLLGSGVGRNRGRERAGDESKLSGRDVSKQYADLEVKLFGDCIGLPFAQMLAGEQLRQVATMIIQCAMVWIVGC